MAELGCRMLAVPDIANIRPDIIDTVFGYIRETDSGLNRRYVPMEVSLICLSYYYWGTNEYFEIAGCSYQVSDSKNEISVGPGYIYQQDTGCALGNVLISSTLCGVFTWKFKILSLNKIWNPLIWIGITSEHGNPSDTEACLNRKDKCTYCFGDNANIYQICDGFNGRSFCMSNGFDEGSLVTMTLDLNKGTLKYKCHGSDEENENEYSDEDESCDDVVGCDDIACGSDIHYRMAVTLQCRPNDKKTQIELVSFSIEE